MKWQTTKSSSYPQATLKDYAKIFDARGRDYHEAMLSFPHARDAEFYNIIKYADLQDGQIMRFSLWRRLFRKLYQTKP